MTVSLELRFLTVWALGLAALVGGILLLNGGHFAYSLDDPYIHLALAENLAAGHYGLNLDEPSSPSSSILWPLLLAPFTRWAGYEWVPLVLATVSLADCTTGGFEWPVVVVLSASGGAHGRGLGARDGRVGAARRVGD